MIVSTELRQQSKGHSSSEGFQRTQRQIDSNARVIEALSADIAANRADIATTRASVDGLVQIIAEFSARSEVRLNRLDDAVVGIERILQELTRRNRNGNDHGDEL